MITFLTAAAVCNAIVIITWKLQVKGERKYNA